MIWILSRHEVTRCRGHEVRASTRRSFVSTLTPRNLVTSRPRSRWITFVVLCAISVAPGLASAQTTRIASDFEIQQMERQAASAKDFLSQISAHLNLGDLHLTRNESAIAHGEYQAAADTAQRERIDARKASDMARYATATMYAGLAQAGLGSAGEAFSLLEEAARYAADDPKTWNVYASAMRVLHQPRKAASTARNAVAIAEREAERSPSPARRLDLAVYRYTLATALNDAGDEDEARRLLEVIVVSLRSKDFDALRKDVERRESFEIYSTARGETAAYLSLLNRSQLELAAIYERQGDLARAGKTFHDVLATRSDDPTALAALARLSTSQSDKSQWYAEAFDANPFSIPLIRDYQRWIARHTIDPSDNSGTGATVRRALEQMARNENRAARSTLEALIARFPANDVVQYLAAVNDVALGDLDSARSRTVREDELRHDLEARLNASAATAPAFLSGTATSVAPSASDLRQLLALIEQQRITPEQHVALDRLTFTSTVTFRAAAPKGDAGQTTFESGSIEGQPFRFSEPTAFAGTFAAETPLRLTYRVLGATELDGSNALLLEPLKLEVAR